MKTVSIQLVLACCMAILFYGCGPQKKIFSITNEQGTTDKKGPEVIQSVNLKVNIEELQAEKNTTVTIPLPGKGSLQLLRKRLDKFEKSRFAWYGVIADDPGSFGLLSITARAVSGKITSSKGKTYMINYIGKNVHRIDEIDAGKLPERKDDDIEVPPSADMPATDKDCPDPATQVDIMVLYTEDAEAGAGGSEGMEAFIYQCIYFTNLAYQNSNVNLAMNLVHHEKVSYTETGNENTDLDRLTQTADGFIDNIHTLRDVHGADLVSMITETMSGCGLAYRDFPVTAGFASSAFSVVKRTCAAAGLSFAHETAHNMGARHDCAQASNSAGENHGHFVANPADGSGSSWRTVLAYNSCGSGPCTRIPYFSNPGLTYSPTNAAATDPMGTVAAAGTCTNNNTLVLNNAAAIVANFRCSSPGIPNVWMRDTWSDTGIEPDPATAGQDMWRSPYIWIRNSAQDATFIHQHEHENPKMGIPNWIYVKLHNGGVADNGNLQVYYAQASVSLSWPGAWTLLTTIPVTINAASTKIVEIPWTGLPGEGHYCMVARWSSTADPVSHTETTDIGNNTRQNNNIVWRNLNIEAMDADEKSETFYIQGDKSINLKVDDEALFPKRPFVESGQIYLKLNDTLMAAWKKGGSKGEGIKLVNNEIQIVAAHATIDNINLYTREKIKAGIRFVKNKSTIPDRYNFTVSQTSGDGKIIAGGVSYEIYTFKR